MRIEYREEPCRSALNPVKGMPFSWSLNPYMGCAHRCTFCYVRAFERRADRPSDDRYGRSIRVKPNVADVLRRELARRSWQREEVALGTATDPYQPAERDYQLSRVILERLAAERDLAVGIISKSPLICRDLDVLRQLQQRNNLSIYVSLISTDVRLVKTLEARSPMPHARLRGLKKLTDAGLNAGVIVAPVLPGINDAYTGKAPDHRRKHLGLRGWGREERSGNEWDDQEASHVSCSRIPLTGLTSIATIGLPLSLVV